MIGIIYKDSLRGLIDEMNNLSLIKDNVISVFVDNQKRYIVIYDN